MSGETMKRNTIRAETTGAKKKQRRPNIDSGAQRNRELSTRSMHTKRTIQSAKGVNNSQPRPRDVTPSVVADASSSSLLFVQLGLVYTQACSRHHAVFLRKSRNQASQQDFEGNLKGSG